MQTTKVFIMVIDTTVKYQALVPVFSKKKEEYYQALDIVLQNYNKANFWITKVQCDVEFKPMMDPIGDNLDMEIDYTSADKHVPKAERNNCKIKERMRAAYHRLPFRSLPSIMIRYLALVQTSN